MHVAVLDVGTTVIKGAIIDTQGRTRGESALPCPCASTRGHIEVDTALLVGAAFEALRDARRHAGLAAKRIAALAVTNQRATLVCCDGEGHPLAPALSWQDMCGAAHIRRLRRKITDRAYYKITGLPNDPVFSLAKILWLKSAEPNLFRRTARFATLQDFLLRQMGCTDHFCDWSNAALTGLFDVNTFRWSPDILELAGLHANRLPLLVPPARKVGCLAREAAHACGLLTGTPLVSGGGDQQCAGVGAGAVKPGVLEITVGTAAVPLCYASRPVRDSRMRVMTCAHALPRKWNVEGLQNAAGACLDWLAGITNRGKRLPATLYTKAEKAGPGAHGVMFLPYLAGASAPHWDPHSSGVFLGLNLSHGKADLLRAVMEGVSFQTREIVDIFTSLNMPVREIRLTGGCTHIEHWNQIQADILGRPVALLANPQATAAGAAVLAAVGAGLFKTVRKASEHMVHVDRVYTPCPDNVEAYERWYRRYQDADSRLRRSGVMTALTRRRN